MKLKLENSGTVLAMVGALLLGASLLSTVGCASFNQAGKRELPQADPSQQYYVEMHNVVGKSEIYTGQLEGDDTVQTALEKSGAIRKYRHMEVAVMRTVAETGHPLRMVVQYSPRERRVVDSENYAIMAGDRIVIEAASTSLLDRLTTGN